jgi:hypothetical protein
VIVKECLNLSNSLCRTLIKIDRLQKKHECPSDRIIIPIILFSKDFTLFKSFGNIGDIEDDCFGCFETMVFKVEEFCKTSCCGKLSLLRPIDENGCIAESVCEIFRLEETDFCVEVDFHCFCSLQRLSMALVNRPFGGIHPK